jgi:hypothetical protein
MIAGAVAGVTNICSLDVPDAAESCACLAWHAIERDDRAGDDVPAIGHPERDDRLEYSRFMSVRSPRSPPVLKLN